MPIVSDIPFPQQAQNMGTSTPKSTFPSRQERTACWTMRDAYFACVREHYFRRGNALPDVNKLPDNPENPCFNFKKEYEKACPAAWIKYFNDKVVADERNKRLLSS